MTTPTDAERAPEARPLANLSNDTLRLELHLRGGPAYQCQSSDCRAFHDGPGKWDTCPSCKRKGFLCGSFVLDKTDAYYKDWERRTFAKYPEAARALPVDGLDAERQLRQMLGEQWCAGQGLMAPYTDDGQFYDGSEHPDIDFMNDAPQEIRRKMLIRLTKAIRDKKPPTIAAEKLSLAKLSGINTAAIAKQQEPS